MISRLIFFVALLIITSTAWAAEIKKATGKIKKLQLFSSNLSSYSISDRGNATIYLDELPVACGSGERRVMIGADHPLFNAVYSTALAAHHSDQPVEIWYLDTCTLRSNSWDFFLIQIAK